MTDLYERGQTVELNGLNTYYLDEGEGTPVLMVHGFPDSAHLWRNQIPALVDAGYRVVAPDLRGFGRTDRPEGVEAYAIVNAVGDVVALLDHLGIEKAHVVGHDWGAGVAWGLGMFLPDRVRTLTVLSVGHPTSFSDRRDLQQMGASWYMLLFQFEGVAEEIMSQNDWEFTRRWLGNEIDSDRYLADLSRPGALTASLNWYRANATPKRYVGEPPDWPKPAMPIMGMWSTGDFALTERQMTESEKHVGGPWRYERVDAPSHWLQLHAPDEVNGLLLDFLASHS